MAHDARRKRFLILLVFSWSFKCKSSSVFDVEVRKPVGVADLNSACPALVKSASLVVMQVAKKAFKFNQGRCMVKKPFLLPYHMVGFEICAQPLHEKQGVRRPGEVHTFR